MFITPSKRKAGEGDEPNGKRVKEESNSTHTSYAKKKYYQILWRAPQTKKHKTWDGDGVLVITGSTYELLDEEAKTLGSGKIVGELAEGAGIKLGGREIQIEREVPPSEFLSGKVFGGATSSYQPAGKTATLNPARQSGFVALKFNAPRLPNIVKAPSHVKGKSVNRMDVQPKPTATPLQPKAAPVVGLYWTANWRRPQARKHKIWEGSGAISLIDGQLKLVNEEGHTVGAKNWKGDPPEFGDVIIVGGHEAEIDAPLSSVEYAESFKPPTVRVVSVEGSGEETLDGAPASEVDLSYDVSPVRSRSPVKNGANHAAPKVPLSAFSVGGARKPTIHAFKPLTVKPAETGAGTTGCWTSNWRKQQTKKHKSWEGFGIVELANNTMKLYNDKGRLLKTVKWRSEAPLTGVTFRIDNLEAELQTPVPMEDFESKTCFEPGYSPPGTSTNLAPIAANSVYVAPRSFYAAPEKKDKPAGPLHDPAADGALVLTSPDEMHRKKYNNKNLPVVPVVVDPMLAKFLRPHQREGIQFMYESVMGMRTHEQHGCILADEMGLGKTLQTIALVWTLLRQNPYYSSSGSPSGVIGKALIVCPVSLVNNWRKEFVKWLGRGRLKVFVGDKDKNNIKQFMHSRIHHVLIIGYEKLRTVIDDLTYCTPPIGLIVCDEGHRLKSAQAKTTKMFEALKRTPRRIILSGTPIQNDLGEFHAMADFCNPGMLEEYSRFRRLYETPILKSRAPEASAKDIELGAARAAQLNELAKSFVLRRTAEILTNYLPPKTEYVLFVQPTALQLSVFHKILRPDHIQDLVHGPTARSLALITTLTKICNSPIMIAKPDKATGTEDGKTTRTLVQEALGLLPAGAAPDDITLSGKLIALAALLKQLRQTTEEKCILVSHYTSTLNIVEAYCRSAHYTYSRLDGSTAVNKRQQLVDEFNQARQSKKFLFLLSSKAGGVGLNLIGASRLVLIDSDWNPSHDLQSMARIHRDGQKRPVFIYRLLTTGTIDEKIYQRQVTKLGLSNSLISEASGKEAGSSTKSSADSFTQRDLQDIFSIHSHTLCQTHELLQCHCSNNDHVVSSSANSDDESELLDPADLARSAGKKSKKNVINDSDSESSSESEVEMGFVSASQVKPGKINQAEKKRRREALAALSEWRHINCFGEGYSELVQDPVLLHLLQAADSTMVSSFLADQTGQGKDWGGMVSFAFEKRSGSQLS
ncbi:putative RAD54-DNA-dependent ATPase of the Snf2p family protein [Rhizoctonia solani 123E]|uniref:Putative RAD54-DNA-dependent ATPase of the Snf2p family protein n=1 Tax=Rhizoctonia solani 123E TaxID=1423351 RepID=A0A074RX45_9AGAM|nr:putative RAD54-DNA-dependent ATPase of the Snf2p family protein [Rhizoctonia solani 123E]